MMSARRFSILGAAALGALLLLHAAPSAMAQREETRKAEDPRPPTGDEILTAVRLSQALQDLKQLKGRLRNDATGALHPFTLTMADNVIRFVFTSPPKESINLDLKQNGTTLTRVTGSGKVEMPASLYSETVRDTAINFEDLSMRFLYWPNAQVVQESATISFQKCWVVRVRNPDNRGPYGWVDLWIHKDSGAMLQMEAWSRSAKKLKQFKVRKGQKYKNAYILKQMRVYSYDPKTGDEVATTYMEIDDPG